MGWEMGGLKFKTKNWKQKKRVKLKPKLRTPKGLHYNSKDKDLGYEIWHI